LENLRLEVERLRTAFRELGNPKPLPPDQQPITAIKVEPSRTPHDSSQPKRSCLSHTVEIPMKESLSLAGIVSYLTKKHRANLHEEGVITITSKSDRSSVFGGALSAVADLTSNLYFTSANEPGQWICWDFRNMRVYPTHYTIRAGGLKSWIVEGSPDGERWTEIDRQTDSNEEFNGRESALSFRVSNPADCRFIRLILAGKNHYHDDILYLTALEFFGTLSD
jgi:hypothetical protein